MTRRKNNPYYDLKIYHRAHLVNQFGDVSPLCAKTPHKIDLTKGQSWTSIDSAVTCPKCLKSMAFQKATESTDTLRQIAALLAPDDKEPSK